MDKFVPHIRDVTYAGRRVYFTVQLSRMSARSLSASTFQRAAEFARSACPSIDHVQNPDSGKLLDTGALSLAECIELAAK
jgi:hypothetical protein